MRCEHCMRGLRLGICSNKPVGFTRELIAYLDVASYLELVLGPEDVAHPKPAPDMLLSSPRSLEPIGYRDLVHRGYGGGY